MLHTLRVSLLAVALSFISATAWSEDIPIANAGITNVFFGPHIANWSHEYSGSGGDGSGSNNVVDVGWFPAPANDELSGQSAMIVCCSNGSYTQELEVNYESNKLYTLQFDVGAPDREPDVFRRVTEYHVQLWRGATLAEAPDLGVWSSGQLVFDANQDAFGTVETTAGAGGVWLHVTAQWLSGNLPPEVTNSPIQIKVGRASTYAVFDNFQLSVDPAPVVLGDYNGNGTVDAGDYVLWRNGGPLANEVADPGVVSAADYTEWKARFGDTFGSGSGSALASVPEPSTTILLAIVTAALSFARRRSEV